MRRPNILLVMSDQEQHWDVLPTELRRDGIAELLDRGIGFARHHVATVPCGPSRSIIYTGQHTRFTGVHTNPSRTRGVGMSTDVPTIGTMLREHGYYTAYKGKWHVSVIDPPTPFSASTTSALEEFGFAEYTPDGDPVGVAWDGFRRDPSVASDAANWLLGHGGGKPLDRPWFLAVNFVNPHDVMFFDATGRMNRDGTSASPRYPAPVSPLYERHWDLDLPDSFADNLANKPAVQATLARFTDRVLGEVPRGDGVAWRALRSYYLNCLRDLDRNVRIVVGALRAAGHMDDTVIVYTTDHGEAGGAHGLRDKPTSMYREVVNVPLIVVHPDVRGGGRRSDALSSALDLAPTILALAGVGDTERAERHPQLRGIDLSSVIHGQSGSGRDERGVLFSMSRPPMRIPGETPPVDPQRTFLRGYFDGRWKFGRYTAADQLADASVPDKLFSVNDLELYDTSADPLELLNLAYEPEFRHTVEAAGTRLTSLLEREVGTGEAGTQNPGQAIFNMSQLPHAD